MAPDRGRELNPERLIGRWVHSHEEDTETEQVFRPPDHPFPPSRGREAWELRVDGTLTVRRPGPTDAPQEAEGTWLLEGSNLLIREGDEDGAERSLAVLEAEGRRRRCRP